MTFGLLDIDVNGLESRYGGVATFSQFAGGTGTVLLAVAGGCAIAGYNPCIWGTTSPTNPILGLTRTANAMQLDP